MLKEWESRSAEDPTTLEWLVRSGVDMDTLKWMQENTKECPQCNTAVQKNQGCYQITCSSCYATWCWLCRGDWATHGSHFKCATYNKGKRSLKVRHVLGPKVLTVLGQARKHG